MILNSPVKSKLLVALGLLSSALAVVAQPSTITYQGQLSSGGSATTGQYDLRFTLYDAATLGNTIGSPVTLVPLGVTNGLFTAALDFGSTAFDGGLRWLEIGVRTNGSAGPYTVLTPRQLLTATPYAIRAANFSGPYAATNLTGKITDTNLSVNVALLTNNAVFTRTVTASNFIGNGIGLTNLSTTNLVGILPDARLSTNVAFRNTSNTVFLGGISATNFYGYGGGLTNVPGRIFEVIPTGTNIQAFANFGYLATNDSTTVVVTLPTTANIRVGETIRVSGSGAAGWIIAQNTNQSILVANLLNNVGVSWITNSSPLNFKAIAASADGRKMVAVINGGVIYTSIDYGVSWFSRASSLNWSSVASSADGSKLVATVNGAFIWTSVDSGTNWLQRNASGARNWTGVASSLDGTRLIACSSQGGFISTDSGATWALNPLAAASWTSVASSANGSNLVATLQGGQIYTSAAGGAIGSWIARESIRPWTCVASSADGSVLVAGANSSGLLYTSTDFGASWIAGTVAKDWSGVACSADGARMIAVANGGGVYISPDTGVTWQFRSNLPSTPVYNGAASSSDGSTVAAVASASGIYVSSKAATTVGAAGSLVGSRLAAVELQHVGNGVFIPVSYAGTIRAK